MNELNEKVHIVNIKKFNIFIIIILNGCPQNLVDEKTPR
jgi:hypothetical protein